MARFEGVGVGGGAITWTLDADDSNFNATVRRARNESEATAHSIDESFKKGTTGASRSLSNFRGELNQTDDVVGNFKTTVENVNTRHIDNNLRSTANTLDRKFTPAVEKGSDALGNFRQQLSQTANFVRNFQVATRGYNMTSLILAVTAGVGALLELGSAAAASVGTLIAIPGIVAGIAPAFGVARVATLGLDEAFKQLMSGDVEKFQEAMKGLTPAAREFVVASGRIYESFIPIRELVQQTFFAGLGKEITELANVTFPNLRIGMTLVASSMNDMIKVAAAVAREPFFQNMIATSLSATARTIETLTRAISPLARSVAGLVAIGLPFSQRLNEWAVRLSESAAAFITSEQGSKKLTDSINTGIEALKVIGGLAGSIAGLLVTIFKTTNQEGLSFITTLTGVINKMNAWMQSTEGQRQMAALLRLTNAVFIETIQVVGTVAGKILDLIEKFDSLSPSVKSNTVTALAWIAVLTPVATYLSGVAGSLVTTYEAFKIISGGITGNIKMLGKMRAAYVAAAAGTSILTGAQAALNVAWMANPVGLVIAAVAALVGIGYVLYKNWTTVVKIFKEWGFMLGLLLGPIGWIGTAIGGLYKAFNYLKGDADKAKEGVKGLNDELNNGAGAAGNLKLALGKADVTLAGTTTGNQFKTAFAKTYPELTAGLTNAMSLDPEPIATKFAVSLTKALREAKFSEAVIAGLDTQTLINQATEGVRAYTATWSQGLDKWGLDNELRMKLIEAGQTMKAEAGLTGQAAADNIAVRFKEKLRNAGIPPAMAAEIANASPAVRLAAGTLGADVSQKFAESLQAYLVSQNVPEHIAREFAHRPDLLNGVMKDIAKSGIGALGITMDEAMKSGAFSPVNVLVAGMEDVPVKLAGLGIAAANSLMSNFTRTIQSGTPQLGGGLTKMVQDTMNIQNPQAVVQGAALGTSLVGGVINGVSTGAPNVNLKVGEVLNGAGTVQVGNARNQGSLLGGEVVSGIKTGVGAGSIGINDSVSSVIQGAGSGNISQAQANGRTIGTNIGTGMQTGATGQGGNLKVAIQGVSNQAIQIDTSGSKNIGKNIVDGAAKGVEENKKSIWDRVGDMAGGALKWARNLLGIKSPSRAFMEVGKNVALGLGIGVENYASTAIASVKSMAEEIAGVGASVASSFPKTLNTSLDSSINGNINATVADVDGLSSTIGSNFENDDHSSRIENHIGTISIASDVDAENWLQKLTRQDEIISTGLTPNV